MVDIRQRHFGILVGAGVELGEENIDDHPDHAGAYS
jgi:hypothetical protein